MLGAQAGKSQSHQTDGQSQPQAALYEWPVFISTLPQEARLPDELTRLIQARSCRVFRPPLPTIAPSPELPETSVIALVAFLLGSATAPGYPPSTATTLCASRAPSESPPTS